MARTLFILDQGLKDLVGHYFEYVRSIVEAATRQGFQCVVGCHESANIAEFASFDALPVYRSDVWAVLPGETHHSARSVQGVGAQFLEDTRRLMRDHPVKPGDIIFMPNIAKPHVGAPALISDAFGPFGVKLHFMFRYPSSHFDGETAAQAFRDLETAASKYDVSLCTDSHRLAEELAPLTALPFHVMPIPHSWHHDAKHVPAAGTGRPLHCVSLGNARGEKGIAEILEAVRLTQNEPWGGRLRFTLQVNNPYEAEEAIAAFRAGPLDPRVTLVERPLDSQEYADLLDSADVVLVPYHRSIYRERTSGVFLEGLTSAKLLLCTQDCWMADLLALHGGGIAVEDRSAAAICYALGEFVANGSAYQAKADRAAAYWQDIHCPENFVAHLSGINAKRVAMPTFGKVAIFFPWGEAVSGNTGASLRLKYLVRYLETIYDEVRILFTGGSEPDGIIGLRSVAESYHYSEQAEVLHNSLKGVCRDLGVPEHHAYHLWFHMWPQADGLFALRCEELVIWADQILVDYTYFVPLIDALCRKHGKDYTVTIHDVVSEQSAETPFLHQATRAMEFDAMRMAPRVICVSEADMPALVEQGIEAELVPALIDADEAEPVFTRAESLAILEQLYDLQLEGRTLCFFVGSSYPPNAEAAEAIRDMADQASRDSATSNLFFLVAGGCMAPARYGNFASLGIIEGAALSASMVLADIILVPLKRGTGVSLKSVEALARGALVLATRIGMRALAVEDGVHCRIEEDLSLYPARIMEMVADSPSALRMRDAARTFGAAFDYRRLMRRYLVTEPQSFKQGLTDANHDARRRDAIQELLPRIASAGARATSPLLREWLNAAPAPSEGQSLVAQTAPSAFVSATDLVAVSSHGGIVSRDDEAFDAEWYRSFYADVSMLDMDSLEHFDWIGRRMGRAPNENALKKKVIVSGGGGF